MGVTVGYELFAKRNDKIRFLCDCQPFLVKDCLGVDQELDHTILQENTNSMAHKFRIEAFHRWNFGELFIGGSQVFAGREVMRESEAHLGFKVYF